MMPRRREKRRGLTLLEVIVAMAIFLISVIAIFRLLFLGTERAGDVRLQTRTSMRCQAKLAEIMVGAEQFNSSPTYTGFSEAEADKDLQWKMEATPSDDKQMLWTVKVWVKAELPSGKVIEAHLCQMMLNPAMRGTTFDQPLATPAGTPTGPEPMDPAAPMADDGTGAGGGKKSGAGANKTGGTGGKKGGTGGSSTNKTGPGIGAGGIKTGPGAGGIGTGGAKTGPGTGGAKTAIGSGKKGG